LDYFWEEESLVHGKEPEWGGQTVSKLMTKLGFSHVRVPCPIKSEKPRGAWGENVHSKVLEKDQVR